MTAIGKPLAVSVHIHGRERGTGRPVRHGGDAAGVACLACSTIPSLRSMAIAQISQSGDVVKYDYGCHHTTSMSEMPMSEMCLVHAEGEGPLNSHQTGEVEVPH